ncbi:hypothetical protein [Desertivirga brevis]|uniref:hypothetical protein n=1 Tax=Desertivirga brevis TaxID=2810310 RepID=UPI001A96FFE8|nr:hypothetical protein [Pedobacter sp. SYSU D00873]
MTESEFKKKIRKGSRWDDGLNYIFCVFIVAFGLVFSYNIYKNGITAPTGYRVLFIPLMCLVPGLYGFWRIPKDYEVFTIKSEKSIDNKRAIVDSYLSTLKVETITEDQGFITCRYRNAFFNKVDLSILIDEEKVLLSARGVDQYGGKGFIDLGLTYRASKKLRKYMQASL